MFFISILVKSYIVLLHLRWVMTRQELYFNPVGKFVASCTEPIFSNIFKKLPKHLSDRYIPLFIIPLVLFMAMGNIFFSGNSFLTAIYLSVSEILSFMMLFYVISIFLGSLSNTQRGNIYTAFFYRIGLFWVKFTRTFIRIEGNTIILPAVLVVFISYLVLNTIVIYLFNLYGSNVVSVVFLLKFSLKTGLFSLVEILRIVTWLIIIRALLSWINPNPSNPLVQILASLTDPFIEPVRRILPPFGMFDFSPIISLFLVEFIRIFLLRFIDIILR